MNKVAVFLVGVFCLLVAPAAVVFSAPSKEGQILLVLAPPWQNEQEIITCRADLVDPEKAPFSAFAASDTFDLEKRLKHAGAWAVLDAQIISQLCGM